MPRLILVTIIVLSILALRSFAPQTAFATDTGDPTAYGNFVVNPKDTVANTFVGYSGSSGWAKAANGIGYARGNNLSSSEIQSFEFAQWATAHDYDSGGFLFDSFPSGPATSWIRNVAANDVSNTYTNTAFQEADVSVSVPGHLDGSVHAEILTSGGSTIAADNQDKSIPVN